MDGLEVSLLGLARCQKRRLLRRYHRTTPPPPDRVRSHTGSLSRDRTDGFYLFLWDILSRGFCNAWNRKR